MMSDATPDPTDPGLPHSSVVRVHPAPSDEEAAAIAAALSLLVATAPGAEGDHEPEPDPRWRFSGRWWSRPVPHARQRPWRF